MQIRQILKTKGSRVVSIPPDASVAEAARLLRQERIGAVVVMDPAGTLAGILSERDIVYGLAQHGAPLLERRVDAVMTRAITTFTPSRSVEEAMREMTAGRFRHIPVVENGSLAGIISIGDVVKSRLGELESESSMLQNYIASR